MVSKVKDSRFAVSSQASLQKICEFGVPVRNVALLEHTISKGHELNTM